MIKFILSLFDYFSRRRTFLWTIFAIAVVILTVAASNISFNEDISAFLPKDRDTERINYAYNNVGAANKLIISFSHKDTIESSYQESIMESVDIFVEYLSTADSTREYVGHIEYRIDQTRIMELSDYLIANMPYFLTERDYQRIDSLMTDSAIDDALDANKSMLLSPMGMMMRNSIMADPLHLSAPLLNRLRGFSASDSYSLRDDYIFSKDGRQGIVTLESRHSASETLNNSELMRLVDSAVEYTESQTDGNIDISYFGSVDIALTNANRIKSDAILSIVLSLVLIISLLIYCFRSGRSLVLIVLSLIFGWLFALGLLTVMRGEVSLIAVGISSIIIGIAINYPLHIIDHYSHEGSVRGVIRNIVEPLTIGNITTVGAFLSLMFINSDAMRDLGLFASLLLVGTICFVLLFLPHLLRKKKMKVAPKPVFEKLVSWGTSPNRWVVWGVVVLSVVFFFLSFGVSFETDMQKINYMTDQQKADFDKYVTSSQSAGTTVYYACEGNTMDEALAGWDACQPALEQMLVRGEITKVSGIGSFLPSKQEQGKRIARWNAFLNKHGEKLKTVEQTAYRAGFRQGSFDKFSDILNRNYVPQEVSFFAPLRDAMADNYIVDQKDRYMVVSMIHSTRKDIQSLEQELSQIDPRSFSFDSGSIGRSIVTSLSDSFNTVLFVCALIVFLFLVLTMGRIELGVLAFLPLTVGWFWILGMMNVMDIRFNIVNIILATLIFGQGDDYTIFITEGLMHEYAYKRKLLASYKNSIMLSALIMFIGIGSLIIARHPAMQSLAQVTIVGMVSVVLMTFLLPPLVFNYLTVKRGKPRLMPVTLVNIGCGIYSFLFFMVGCFVITVTGFALFGVGRSTPRKKLIYHKLINSFARFVINNIPRVKTIYDNSVGETFQKPAVIICNHQSHIDLMCILMLTPKLIILTNDWVWRSPFYGWLIRYADFLPVTEGLENDVQKMRELVNQGYSIMVFPEGTRSEDCSIMRFHRGAFFLAEKLGLEVLPVLIHGVGHLLPKSEFMLRKGEIHIKVFDRVDVRALGETYSERARAMRAFYREQYEELASRVETADYYVDLVRHNYIYKGTTVERNVVAALKRHENYRSLIDSLTGCRRVAVDGCGYGEMPLLLSLVYKTMNITAAESDPDKLALAMNCASVKQNLHYFSELLEGEYDAVVLMNPSQELRQKWQGYKIYEL